MPIAKELRKYYGKPWQARRAQILQREDHKCKWCKKPDRTSMLVTRDGTGRWFTAETAWRDSRGLPCQGPSPWPVPLIRRVPAFAIYCILTVAHLNHNPEDNSDQNLAALCQRCHLVHDHKHHRRTFLRRHDDRTGQSVLFAYT